MRTEATYSDVYAMMVTAREDAALGLGFDDFLNKSAGDRGEDQRRPAVFRFFFAEAERLLGEGRPINLIFFDLDDFKRVNDTLGHLAGDRILGDIGSLFLRHTRHEDFIARYGGDEFVMLVTSVEPSELDNLVARQGSVQEEVDQEKPGQYDQRREARVLSMNLEKQRAETISAFCFLLSAFHS